MITIDRALRDYTDKLNSGADIGMEYFKNNLSIEDYDEFIDLSRFILFLNLHKKAVQS